MYMASRYAGSSSAGSAYAAPSSPTTSGSTAMASRPATRATALLTPLAMPACRSGAAASTVAVNGATVNDRPRPNSDTGGSTSAK